MYLSDSFDTFLLRYRNEVSCLYCYRLLGGIRDPVREGQNVYASWFFPTPTEFSI